MAYSEEQMRRIIAEYGPSVWRLAMAWLRNTADAEDIYQEVFLKLIRAKPTFESDAHQKAWFLQVTANCCKDHLKKAGRRHAAEEQPPAAEPAGENDALEAALDALPDRYRTIIHLYYFEGYQTGEIAGILKMKPSTVRSGLKRARKRLKDFMEGEVLDV